MIYTRLLRLLPFLIGFLPLGCAQNMPANARVESPAFQDKLEGMLRFDVPVVNVREARALTDSVVFLDTREPQEYMVSHLPGALLLGYDQPDFTVLDNLPKDTPIVLYCSVGYRSEKMGRTLQQRGFTDVRNLYGSIFEWVNAGYPVVDKAGYPTGKVHTYNKRWSRWVAEGRAEKVY